jgi:hypothetical protein
MQESRSGKDFSPKPNKPSSEEMAVDWWNFRLGERVGV